MRSRTFLLFALAALAGAAVAVLPALAAAPSETKLEVNEDCVEANWPCWALAGSSSNPPPASKITIAAGGEVKFKDDETAAAVVWTGSAPSCSGVPTSARTDWEGSCKFEAAGTYEFESSTLFDAGPSLNYTRYEVVVEGAATGTSTTTSIATTPSTTTTTAPAAPGGPSYTSTPVEGAAASMKLAGKQRGSAVRGSIDVPQADSGGKLEVVLSTSGVSSGEAERATQTRVGRLARSPLKAGSESFAVPLNAKGRSALRRRRHLAVTVKIALVPLHGSVARLARVVVVRA